MLSSRHSYVLSFGYHETIGFATISLVFRCGNTVHNPMTYIFNEVVVAFVVVVVIVIVAADVVVVVDVAIKYILLVLDAG